MLLVCFRRMIAALNMCVNSQWSIACVSKSSGWRKSIRAESGCIHLYVDESGLKET